jgi:iron complex transport system substrate-binding protein
VTIGRSLRQLHPVPAPHSVRTGFVFLRTAFRGVMVGAVVTMAACHGDQRAAPTTNSAITLVDDAGDTVRLARSAERVVSLVPSATETIIALAAIDRLVGRTRFDVDKAISNVPSVGGTVDASIESIVALRPDLVIGWGKDIQQTIRARLASLNVPVFAMRAEDTSDVFRGIRNLGKMLARDSAAASLSASIRATLDSVRAAVTNRAPRNVMFVIYPDPAMTAGPHTFIDELIGVAGGRSVFRDLPDQWPTVSMEEIVRRQPDLLIVSQTNSASALAQFRGRTGWRDLPAVRGGRVATVSADLTQRPGARIGEAARALQLAIHPETRPR